MVGAEGCQLVSGQARIQAQGRIGRRAFLVAGALAVAAACGSDDGDRAAPAGTSSPSSPSPPATPPPPAAFVDHVATARPRVALTFHTDGDVALAGEMLDVLAARDTVMTAFVVGEWLDANPSWGRRLVDAGHEVANHTYTHPSFLALPPLEMVDEVLRCREVLARDAGVPGTLFRPSGTDDGTAAPPADVLDLAARAGYPTVLGFDVDPFDYQDPGAEVVVQRTLAAVEPGAIVSLHFGHPGTVEALPAILDGLDERGLRPVTASALLRSA
jgi:peptidoglycan/xylan/chitin deacetylase (PgdA/CDA1 family)